MTWGALSQSCDTSFYARPRLDTGMLCALVCVCVYVCAVTGVPVDGVFVPRWHDFPNACITYVLCVMQEGGKAEEGYKPVVRSRCFSLSYTCLAPPVPTPCSHSIAVRMSNGLQQLYAPPAPPEHIRPVGPLTLDTAIHEHQELAGVLVSIQQPRRSQNVWCLTCHMLVVLVTGAKQGVDMLRGLVTGKASPGNGGERDLTKLSVKWHHVVKAVPHRVFSITIHPTAAKPIAFAGDKWGNVGMWSPHDIVDHEDDDVRA